MPTALITGISGQDGSYLTELLLAKGYEVHGIVRPTAAERLSLKHPKLHFLTGDLRDEAFLTRVLQLTGPDEVYNLAANSFVPACWQEPLPSVEFNGLAVQRWLEVARQVCPRVRFLQASSAEMFGAVQESPQRETTPFRPHNLYGLAKLFAHHAVGIYRAAWGLFACSAILFNHEGPRRGLQFVTRKITHAAARIKLGLETELRLGNLQARRDWTFAGDIVEAMWLMLQHEQPDDFVLGSGETHTVQEFVELAFARVGLDWRRHVVVDPQFYRPMEAMPLAADPAKARKALGWQPRIGLEQLVHMMVDADLATLTEQARVAA